MEVFGVTSCFLRLRWAKARHARWRTRTRRWKVSLPAFLAMYLLAAMRPASRDSDESCSFSQLYRGENGSVSAAGKQHDDR